MAREIYKNIYKKIKKYQNIVIARHIGPDPDAVTSQIALRDAIKLTFPKKNVYAVGASVSRFKTFGVLDRPDFSTLNNVLLIITDVPTVGRVDGIDGLKYTEIIKIDHHPYADKVGNLELIDDTASSVCQLIAELILETNLKMDKNIASNLFLGIVSDSDRFLLSYTTAKTFQIASKLIESQNLDFINLYPKLYERPLNELQFFGYLTENLQVSENGFAYLKISPEILAKYQVDTSTPSNMINDFNYIKEILVWTFITYDDKNSIYKINIRSRGPIINEIAEKYHGGGHKFASGVRLKDEQNIDNLLEDLDNVCKIYKENEVNN